MVPEPLTYTLRFRGEAVQLEDGLLWAECHAPAGVFAPAIGPDETTPRFEILGGSETICRRELELHDNRFVTAGEIDFGAGDAVTFHAKGNLSPSPEPDLRHGSALCQITGGRGRFAGTTGTIASQFLLTHDRQLTDHQLGLLFIEHA